MNRDAFSRVARRLSAGGRVGGFESPSILLILAAAIGASLLLIVAVTRWGTFGDEHAYWLAGHHLVTGEPLYDPSATAVTLFAYQYAPVFAQVLAPVTALVPAGPFAVIWTFAMLFSLYWLAGRRALVALALIALVPVAVEFWWRNVHLMLAVLIVLGITRWPVAFAVGGLIKLSPGVALVYYASAGRWRHVAVIGLVSASIVLASVVLAPGEWQAFMRLLASRGPNDGSSVVPVPYWIRICAAILLAALAGRMRPQLGEPLLVIAIVVGLPTLWVTAFSTLVAIVPVVLWRRSRLRQAAQIPAAREPVETSGAMVSTG